MIKEKQKIIITGATRGLGAVMLKHFLDQGYYVIGTGTSSSPPDNWIQNSNLTYKQLDLGELCSIQPFVSKISSEFGSIYGLINNAALGLDGVLATMHESEIEKLVRVNVTGTLILSKYVLRLMFKERRGRLVNISSIIGTTGFSGLSVYGATKSALQGFTRSLAREVGKVGVTVNSVSPGYMETDMTAGIDNESLEKIKRRSPLRCLAEPDDVVEVVSLLLSERGRNITGVDYVVDAGSTI